MGKKGMTRATATPLASIFGSGFLVIVPILAHTTGALSLPAMAGVCGFAFLVGSVIRFNIAHVEPLVDSGGAGRLTVWTERVADAAIVLAYVISVCLYIRILSSFLLGGLGVDGPLQERALTTAIVLLITAVGVTRGLKALVSLEDWALWVTMGVIAAVIVGFLAHDAGDLARGSLGLPPMPTGSLAGALAVLGGAIICVQGFETARYLGEEYDTDTRIRSCRYSQLVSTAVYLVFIAAATPLMRFLTGPPQDDALIGLAGRVFSLLPYPLVAAAVLSQFSAAVADTLGGEGNMVESLSGRVSHRTAYLLIGAGAVAITWVAGTFQIVALASRAFALYYMVQCLSALTVARGAARKAGLAALAAALLGITVFATPVG